MAHLVWPTTNHFSSVPIKSSPPKFALVASEQSISNKAPCVMLPVWIARTATAAVRLSCHPHSPAAQPSALYLYFCTVTCTHTSYKLSDTTNHCNNDGLLLLCTLAHGPRCRICRPGNNTLTKLHPQVASIPGNPTCCNHFDSQTLLQ